MTLLQAQLLHCMGVMNNMYPVEKQTFAQSSFG